MRLAQWNRLRWVTLPGPATYYLLLHLLLLFVPTLYASEPKPSTKYTLTNSTYLYVMRTSDIKYSLQYCISVCGNLNSRLPTMKEIVLFKSSTARNVTFLNNRYLYFWARFNDIDSYYVYGKIVETKKKLLLEEFQIHNTEDSETLGFNAILCVARDVPPVTTKSFTTSTVRLEAESTPRTGALVNSSTKWRKRYNVLKTLFICLLVLSVFLVALLLALTAIALYRRRYYKKTTLTNGQHPLSEQFRRSPMKEELPQTQCRRITPEADKVRNQFGSIDRRKNYYHTQKSGNGSLLSTDSFYDRFRLSRDTLA